MVGDTLRRERERQKLSIKDIEQGTSIRAIYIEAIEKGDFEALPGDVYAKGFVRNYASLLGLDATACVRQYQEDTVPGFSAEEEAPAARQAEPQDGSHMFATGDDYTSRVEQADRKQNAWVLAAILAALLAGAWLAFGDSLGGEVAMDSPKPQATQKAPVPAPQPAEQPAGAPAPAPVSPGEIDLRAQFTDRCWMQVIADGQVVYEGTAEKGQAMSWKAKDRIVITAGNAGAVDITQNGKLLGNPGDYGAVVEKVYTRDAVAN